MRTDAKIGFAIGGVLLAVLTVYAIVVPKHKKTTAGTVSLVTQVPAAVTPSATDVAPPTTPPLAVGEGALTSSANKDTVIPPAVAPVPTPPVNNAIVDNSSGPIGFHPLVPPQETPKADDQKPSNLVDGVYTPSGVGHVKPAKGKHTITPLPDETTDVATASDRTYVIKSGQTLSKIAYEVYGNSRFWVAIQRENKGLDSNHLKVGSKINLPDISPLTASPVTVGDEEIATPVKPGHTSAVGNDPHTYIVKSGDSLYGIAKKVLGSGRKAEALYAMNKDLIGPDKSRLKLGMVLKLPANGAGVLADSSSVR